MNGSQEILNALGFQGFVHLGEGNFELINQSTDWFETIVTQAIHEASGLDDSSAQSTNNQGAEIPSSSQRNVRIANGKTFDDNDLALNKPFKLAVLFPFIENFLIDANRIWLSNTETVVDSGVWTEQGADGNEYQLVLKAFSVARQSMLLIENISDQFPEKQGVYQRMRELALINEKLIVELNRRQRSLQKEILKTIEQKASMRELEKEYQHHAAAVMICQSDGHVEVANNALVNIYRTESNGENTYQSLLEHWVNEAEQIYPEIKTNIEAGRYWEGNFQTTSFDGTKKVIQLSISPVWGEDLKINHYVCIAYDLSDFKVEDEDSDESIEFDFTTKLPNRRYFWHKFEQRKASADSRQVGFALVLIDLDNFKQINDEFGHMSADKVLVTIGGRISSSVKHDDFVAHLGGDEYAILLDYHANELDTSLITERLLRVINEPLMIEDSLININCSIGITTYRGEEISNNELFKQADLALHYAKQQGKNCAQRYHKKLEKRPESLKKIQHLRAAMIQRQFELYYQPQVPCDGSDNYRAEALLRWNHPTKGLLYPGEFLELLESSGLIVSLGYWIIHQACRQIKILQDEGLSIVVAVNISAKQLHHASFYKELKKAIKKANIAPSSLELEITEHCFVGEEQSVIKLLQKIRELGVLVAIDDFGSGYSSLSYLKKLPVDVLKIDRSFITELPGDTESKAIIQSILQLAEALDLKVVAEGVETEQQFRFLLDYHCHYIQGYIFSPAVKFNQLAGLLKRLKVTQTRK
ncbi:bifunctional diguanylate cyclase/phosphodiesterase [Aliikangiella marina]|uniref:Bifunctional diguanylate cyclase/phosphodiesterase n=1 Tax=Aliikangiella marina TaxID=1712262 RepID=A0A545TJD0_9GAMM|nr:EAL domain-containing protein [Aliikangiella marina]TQV77276.1 bifunctional diguanylate cyclase/phosphodiesterase [Aliikangiella marina]